MSPRAATFTPEILRRRVDPDLPGVEARLAAYRQNAFARHIHDAWCVGVVLAGATRVWHRGILHRVPAGSVVCIAPGELHACNPEPDGRLCSIMFYLSPEAVLLAAGEPGEAAFVAPLANDPARVKRLAGMYRIMTGPATRLEKETLFCRTLGPLFSARNEREPRRDSEAVSLVREYLRQCYRQSVSLAELAALAGRSPTHVLRLFKRETGLPPHAYQNFLRVEQAKALLAKGLPAARVAQEVGFADQSHLIRTFTPLVGATPHQFCQSLGS
jgi:AraC-like DNA-binding protein